MSELLSQQYALVEINKVKPHPKNPRRGDDAAIQASISKNGFYGAIAVQKSTCRILAGNHRWEAAKAQGLDKIPVVWLDVDDKTALRILLADNKTSDLAAYEQEALAEILMQLRTAEELAGSGYEEIDVGKLLKEIGDAIIEANAEDEGPAKQKSVNGYKEQYGVIVMCEDEKKQEEVFEKLTAEGYECKVVVT
jgi:ParB-like chromosome segregation protein Spo0J